MTEQGVGIIKHIVKEWSSSTKVYTCVCGFKSKENIKPHSLTEVTCLDCLRITVKNQSTIIQALTDLGDKIAKYSSRYNK